jgi:hypothetical protein
MGKQIDHNHRYTEEEREYLRSRGRGHMLIVNERRFGTEDNPTDEPEGPVESKFYDDSVRQQAVYDVGGAPLPNTTLDYNTGRVMDRNNGQLLEYTGPGHTPGAYDLRVDGRREPEGFDSYSDDDDAIDEDIVQEVLNVPNKAGLKKRLSELGQEVDSSASREDLENQLAVALQDERDNEKADA